MAKLDETLHMVGVFVGDENGSELFRSAPDSGQAFANLSKAEAGINEQARVIGLKIGAIAGRTAR